MPSYPLTIRRCQHLRINGTQCGSPALREEKYCYFHARYYRTKMEAAIHVLEQGAMMQVNLEDANSIQVGLAEVVRLLVTKQVDHRTASLLLSAMRTASSNLKRISIEPEQPTQVVIDRDCVERRPIGATAWSKVEGREYDDLEQPAPEKNVAKKKTFDELYTTPEAREFMAHFTHLTEGLERDPNFLDVRPGELARKQEEESRET
jgi:hypothetical protein